MKSLGNVFILGDSYSTYEGYIPDGYETFYADSIPQRLKSYKETWWARLIKDTFSHLVANESYCGTTICSIAHWGRYSEETSFVNRFNKCISDGFFEKNKVNTFFIFGGTNDSIAEAELGTEKFTDFTCSDMKKSVTAFCYILTRIKEISPNARVVAILNCGINKELTKSIVKASKDFGYEYVILHDIDKDETLHPTALGMKQIEEQIIAKLYLEI